MYNTAIHHCNRIVENKSDSIQYQIEITNTDTAFILYENVKKSKIKGKTGDVIKRGLFPFDTDTLFMHICW